MTRTTANGGESTALVESLRQKATMAALRADISEAFHRRDRLDAVLQACTEALVRNLDAAFARIWVLDKPGTILELRASAGIYTHLDGAHSRIKVGDYKIGRIAKNLQPHISNSVITDPEISSPEWAQKEGMVAFAGYPLLMEGKALGVIAFFAKHPLSPDVLNEFAPIADGISQWIKRKQSENALADQQEWLRVTLLSIGDAVIATDTAGLVTFMNSVAENLTGWSSEEALHQPLEQIFHIVHEESRKVVENPVKTALREKRVVDLSNHTVLLAKDGRETAIDDSAAPIRDGNNEIIGVILVFHAITARRQAERERMEALQIAQGARAEAEILNRVGRSLASELQIEKVVQIVVDACRELSGAEFGAFFYNATDQENDRFAHCELSGLTTDKLADLALLRTTPLLEPLFRGSGLLRISDLVADGYGEQMERWKKHRADPPFRSFLAAPVISRSGTVLGVLLFGHPEPWKFSESIGRLIEGVAGQAASALDNCHLFGALARAKATLSAQADELEKRVAERTARLEETIASLEGVSYSIAHDLRGPLRSMESFSTALLEDCPLELSPRAHDYASRISAAAKRMDVLTKELLAYGQLANQAITVSPVDCDQIVRNALLSLESIIDQTGAKITVTPLGTVLANAVLLEQAVVNLLVNSLKFTKAGVPPQIDITANRGEKIVLLQFKDNGIGIASQHRTRIFKIFERLSPKEYPGTGIGLAMVKKSIDRMGGAIGVNSSPGIGSTFWIELPYQ